MTDLYERRGFSTDIYEPAEDSYLLADVCKRHISSDMRVLDIGSGTGYVAEQIRETVGASVIGVDINPHACERTAARGIPVIRGDLLEAFTADQFDAIVCNPPYLPTDPEESSDDWLAVALSGGPSGRDVVEHILADAGRVLRTSGDVYLLVSSLMDIDQVRGLAERQGFNVRELDRDEGFQFEVLAVLHLSR